MKNIFVVFSRFDRLLLLLLLFQLLLRFYFCEFDSFPSSITGSYNAVSRRMYRAGPSPVKKKVNFFILFFPPIFFIAQSLFSFPFSFIFRYVYPFSSFDKLLSRAFEFSGIFCVTHQMLDPPMTSSDKKRELQVHISLNVQTINLLKK